MELGILQDKQAWSTFVIQLLKKLHHIQTLVHSMVLSSVLEKKITFHTKMVGQLTTTAKHVPR